jgi:ferredoxin
MRRIDYKGEEYLIHTRSGLRLIETMRESHIPVECDCDMKAGTSSALCQVKWPKDTAFLLTGPTPFEQKILGTELDRNQRLACQAMFK